MEKSPDFLLATTDAGVSDRLRSLPEGSVDLDRRFTQEEDFFVVLDRPFVVDPFDIHHDVGQTLAPERYLAVIRSLVDAWAGQVPQLFRDLSWYFDPRDLFHPLFVQVLSARDKRYLYVLRPDLSFRGRHGEVIDRGGNDSTPRYSTRHLFLESEVLPLESWGTEEGGKRLSLTKVFGKTWQGESGKGYFVTGRWIDQEISRLLSKAAFPKGTRTFPLLPLRCRHDTLSVRCVSPTPEGRRRAALVLEAAWPLVETWAERIQNTLRADPWRDDHPLVEQLRAQWGDKLSSRWGGFRLEAFLDDHEQKEYRYYED
jgi:hypothetical protein